jgi:GH24 family phage-related lysozyme (muramidase)
METPPEEFVKIITEFEGTKRKGYVPRDNGGNIIGKSGVTIGKGLDLGHQSEDSLKAMGFDGGLLNKLKPYLGFRGQQAAEVANTLELDEAEEKELNTKVTSKYWNDFNNYFKSYVGYDSAELPSKARYAVASRFFNSGSSIFKGTNFTKQLKNRQYEDAASNLETWFNPKGKYKALVPRVQKEAQLFREGFADQKTFPDNII